MIRFPRYKGRWHDSIGRKLQDASKHQWFALYLGAWATAAIIYITTLYLYELAINTSKEIKQRRRNKK